MVPIAMWTAEKLDRGSQVIVIISYDGESMGHLTFWKEHEKRADEWLTIVDQLNKNSTLQ